MSVIIAKDERRLLDQFAYCYTRLQDDMGTKLMPASLSAMGEEIAPMPMLDRLNRLEQLGWLTSAEEWQQHRHIRNEFAHDYPETASRRYEHLVMAMESARKILSILDQFISKISKRFPDVASE